MIRIERYTDNNKEIWNKFCRESKNPSFIFNRDYMEYHKDRFHDYSLMLYEDDKLTALLPLNESGDDLISHGGLTYGGFITNSKMRQQTMNDCFTSFFAYAMEQNYLRMIYKPIPHIYHIQPAEEDRYALFVNGAQLLAVEASTVINLSDPCRMSKGRKAQISRAKREGVHIEEGIDRLDFSLFIDLENLVLQERHGTKAVHTGDELFMLRSRFPENIHLMKAMHEGKMIAGVVVFEYKQMIHIQYMAANEKARKIGALDLTVECIIDKYTGLKKWLDFGISTEDGGRYLNEGLIFQKEGFGGRTNVYEKWIMRF